MGLVCGYMRAIASQQCACKDQPVRVHERAMAIAYLCCFVQTRRVPRIWERAEDTVLFIHGRDVVKDGGQKHHFDYLRQHYQPAC